MQNPLSFGVFLAIVVALGLVGSVLGYRSRITSRWGVLMVFGACCWMLAETLIPLLHQLQLLSLVQATYIALVLVGAGIFALTFAAQQKLKAAKQEATAQKPGD